jgi:hypothetical protein
MELFAVALRRQAHCFADHLNEAQKIQRRKTEFINLRVKNF